MIAAGFVLLAIGGIDLLREFVSARRRWIGFAAGGVVLVALGALSNAVLAALVAIVLATVWTLLTPPQGRHRAGFWPVVIVGAVCAAAVAFMPARTDAGLLGELWNIPSPVGPLTFDHSVLLLGTVVFLLESANVVVRTALAQERVSFVHVVPTVDEGTDAVAPAAAPLMVEGAEAPPAPDAMSVEPVLKGGRLIGPLERLMVFALTLAGMYPLIAAVLAAKGIVRFPEISRDSAAGNRAEYFLIGSLVSWVLALAGAFLVWWGFATPAIP